MKARIMNTEQWIHTHTHTNINAYSTKTGIHPSDMREYIENRTEFVVEFFLQFLPLFPFGDTCACDMRNILESQ